MARIARIDLPRRLSALTFGAPPCHKNNHMTAASTPNSPEGSLEAPTRHPLDWKNPDFWDQASLDKELARTPSTSATAAAAA